MTINYKVEPYEVIKQYDEMFSLPETRYRIVSIETGEILDDAQGYGYKSARNAHVGYAYKTKSKKKNKKNLAKARRIQKWLKEHNEFLEDMEYWCFKITSGSMGKGLKFDDKIVNQMLIERNLETDFSAKELLLAWQKMSK